MASESLTSAGSKYPHKRHGPLKITDGGGTKGRREPDEEDTDMDQGNRKVMPRVVMWPATEAQVAPAHSARRCS